MVVVKYNHRKIKIPSKEVSFLNTGLIFRTRNTKNLWFRNIPKGNFALTSWFVFFPFLVLWLDDGNNVVDMRIARPFMLTINSKKKFSSLLEIPLNKNNTKIVDFFVGNKKEAL